jgi:hypothetical protein
MENKNNKIKIQDEKETSIANTKKFNFLPSYPYLIKKGGL